MEPCSDPALVKSVFGAVKLIKNANIDQYEYSRYGIGFDMKGTISFPTLEFGKNVIIFGDMSSSVNVDNKEKHILILVEGPAQDLDDTDLTAEKNI